MIGNEPEFTNGHESLTQLIPGLPVWVELGRDRKIRTLPGVVRDHAYKGVHLWIKVDITYTDLAGQSHIISTDVRPRQLRRRGATE